MITITIMSGKMGQGDGSMGVICASVSRAGLAGYDALVRDGFHGSSGLIVGDSRVHSFEGTFAHER